MDLGRRPRGGCRRVRGVHGARPTRRRRRQRRVEQQHVERRFFEQHRQRRQQLDGQRRIEQLDIQRWLVEQHGQRQQQRGTRLRAGRSNLRRAVGVLLGPVRTGRLLRPDAAVLRHGLRRARPQGMRGVHGEQLLRAALCLRGRPGLQRVGPVHRHVRDEQQHRRVVLGHVRPAANAARRCAVQLRRPAVHARVHVVVSSERAAGYVQQELRGYLQCVRGRFSEQRCRRWMPGRTM